MANNLMAMFQPRGVYTPLDAMNDVGQARNALASGQLNTMKANALGQEMADNEAINQVMTQNGGDLNRAMQDPNLNWKAKQQIGGMIAEQEQAKADAQVKRVESQIKNWQYAGNRVGSAQSQEDWDAARDEVRSVLGDDFARHLPEQYSPESAQQFGNAAMTHAEKIAAQREERQARYQNQSLDLQERRLQNAEARASGGGVDAQDKGWEVKETANGLVRVNKYTGDVAPIQMNGETVQGKQAASVSAVDRKMQQDAMVADKDYQNSLDAATQADALLNKATGSGLGRARDQAYAMVGQSTEGAQAAAQLKVVAGKLVAAVPKFSGPQSDADVKLYREMAGQVGDESLPVETRRAALTTVMELQKGESERRKAMLEGRTPQQPDAPAPLSEQDSQAMQWAQSNPNDPRAQAIMQRLGGR